MNREAKKALTREKIITSATTLFTENGVNNTDLKSIATHAGISVVTFYKYFTSKELLVTTIAQMALDQLFDDMTAIANQSDLNFLDKFKAFSKVSDAALTQIHQTFGPDLLTLFDKDHTTFQTNFIKRRNAFFDTIIEIGRQDGFFKMDVSNTAIRMYLDMILSYRPRADLMTAADALTPKELTDQLENLYFYGLMGAITPDQQAPFEALRQQNKTQQH